MGISSVEIAEDRGTDASPRGRAIDRPAGRRRMSRTAHRAGPCCTSVSEATRRGVHDSAYTEDSKSFLSEPSEESARNQADTPPPATRSTVDARYAASAGAPAPVTMASDETSDFRPAITCLNATADWIAAVLSSVGSEAGGSEALQPAPASALEPAGPAGSKIRLADETPDLTTIESATRRMTPW